MDKRHEFQLRASGIGRSFDIGRTHLDVLKGISLDVRPGETVFLCGASGAGKTTLLYTLAGLERPECGEVEFEGHSIYRLGGERLARLRNARMGFIFQGYFLLPELTALENVLVPALISGRAATGRARELLELVGLADRENHLPSELSGGEQQRVAIARALVNAPGIIFADEPTGNLDAQTGAGVISALLKLSRKENRTLLVVTHDQSLARSGDRLLRIENGSIHEEQPEEPASN
jgi:predicted ABC-type transport system involved in lysophospholipase L1 biosynthesis ATPase subunit